MPTYNYQCDVCQEKFWELVRENESEKDVRCPHCGSNDVTREFPAPRKVEVKW